MENTNCVAHPSHYNALGIEALVMMEKIWGQEDVITFCRMNSFKYRLRAGHKDDAVQDIEKALYYENYAQKLLSRTVQAK